ncbi:tetratricopeptide repeat protein [Fulvivirga sp.]|uniref:tetratricopeptide repeat protein n=1 Tax=Fulvivirga sp. TaxID=1931237 RepID=UPI0032ECC84B
MRKGLLILLMVFLAFKSDAFQNLDSLENALKTAQGKNRVDVLNKLYIVYNRLNPTKALEQSILALELANEISYPNGRAAALNNIGVIYKNQGVYDEALEYYIESLRISTEIDDKKAQASTLNNIGTVYSLKKVYDKALIYFIESYDLFKSIGANGSLIDAINNIGNAYMEMGREDLALDYYSEAMALSSKNDIQLEGSSNSLNNVGNVYFYRGDYANALLYYQRALELEESSGNILGEAYSKSNLGATYIEIKDFKSAKANLDSALVIAQEMSAYPLLQIIYKNQARLYYETKDYKKAYETRMLFDQAKDFVFNDESSRMMAQMEVAVELQEKEKELQRLRTDQQIQSLQIENSRIVIILGVMGSIILLGAGFIILKVRKKAIT